MLSSNVVLAALMVPICFPSSQASKIDGKPATTDTVMVDWSNQKAPVSRVVVSPSPAEYMKIIDQNETLKRAEVTLDGSTTVEFLEKPRDIDFYDSTVMVRRDGKPDRSFDVGKLINHQALSLAHIGFVPIGEGTGMLIAEYEGGAVGAREGFAILRFSPSGFDLHTLPLTDFGKVVVFKSKPEQAEIWSALPDNAGSDAEPRFYATQTCHWRTDGYICDPPKRKLKRFYPAAIDQPGIEIR